MRLPIASQACLVSLPATLARDSMHLLTLFPLAGTYFHFCVLGYLILRQ